MQQKRRRLRRRFQASSLSPRPPNNPTSPSSFPSPSIASTRSFLFICLSLSASEKFFKYLIKFLNFLKEPELLRVDAERIRRQMQEVAVGNYRAFIAAADALISIREEVSSIDKNLESLVIVLLFYLFYLFLFWCFMVLKYRLIWYTM